MTERLWLPDIQKEVIMEAKMVAYLWLMLCMVIYAFTLWTPRAPLNLLELTFVVLTQELYLLLRGKELCLPIQFLEQCSRLKATVVEKKYELPDHSDHDHSKNINYIDKKSAYLPKGFWTGILYGKRLARGPTWVKDMGDVRRVHWALLC